MKKLIPLLAFLCPLLSVSQSLNWNSVSYTAGTLTHGFGAIGSPASTVSLAITGSTARIDPGFPVKFAADPPGTADDCVVNCAVRSSVTFTTLAQTVIYTFSFSPAVSGISFRIYDIDGDNTSGDKATVTATGPSGAQNITMANLNTPSSTIAGSGTTTASVTGTQGNTTDHQTSVSISGFVSTLVITYADNPANPSAGTRSFSIGNITWLGVLPVKWVSFTGKKINNGAVQLNWQTDNETNADKYSVERSKDGQNFVSIGDLAARGGNARNDYSFIDANPGNGNTIYRIRQLDLDGRYDFSSVVLIKQQSGLSGATLYPNPAINQLNLSLPGNVQLKQVKIFDGTGRLVVQANTQTGKLDISSLKPGLYYLRAENNSGEVYNERFTKQE